MVRRDHGCLGDWNTSLGHINAYEKDNLRAIAGEDQINGSLLKIHIHSVQSLRSWKDDARHWIYGDYGKRGLILIVLRFQPENDEVILSVDRGCLSAACLQASKRYNPSEQLVPREVEEFRGSIHSREDAHRPKCACPRKRRPVR